MNTQGCDKPCHKINPAALQWTVSFLLLKKVNFNTQGTHFSGKSCQGLERSVLVAPCDSAHWAEVTVWEGTFAFRRIWKRTAKFTHEKSKPGLMPCFGTRLGSHPGGEASEVQANKGKRYICQDRALSRPNLHDTLSAKFCGISHNTLGVRPWGSRHIWISSFSRSYWQKPWQIQLEKGGSRVQSIMTAVMTAGAGGRWSHRAHSQNRVWRMLVFNLLSSCLDSSGLQPS